MEASARRPKLLVVLPASSYGGAESCAHDLLRLIDDFSPVLLAQAAIKPFYAELPIAVHLFDDFGCFDPYLMTPKNILAQARAVKEVARRERPNAILGIMHNS